MIALSDYEEAADQVALTLRVGGQVLTLERATQGNAAPLGQALALALSIDAQDTVHLVTEHGADGVQYRRFALECRPALRRSAADTPSSSPVKDTNLPGLPPTAWTSTA